MTFRSSCLRALALALCLVTVPPLRAAEPGATVPSAASMLRAPAPQANNAAPSPATGTVASGAAANPDVRPQAPQLLDYGANVSSDAFGANLFSGAFARKGAAPFNPDYVIATGDQVQVRLWGAFEFDAALTVDAQGNVFVPHAGPIPVRGARNQDLQRILDGAIAKVFRANVSGYASLLAAQPVRVFVGGNVPRPGLYNGTSMDSVLHYLDQAGGIDPERGTFLQVQVKRGTQLRAEINLYDFLLKGTMPAVQLADGDVIFVPPRQNSVRVQGLVENAKRFEFADGQRTVGDLVRLAKPKASATHVRVVRNTGTVRNTEYHTLSEGLGVTLQNGDELEFTADKKPGTITVRVEGDHLSAQEYVLPYGARMGELLRQVRYSDRSDRDSLQLFRQSVKERQKLLLEASLKSLESAALTARSGTSDEATLRREEAGLLLQWVERARKVEPSGQVVVASAEARDQLLLENGDIVRVPTLDGLVLVSGEVLFPNASAYGARMKVDDYIQQAGGYTQNADVTRIVVARRDGSYVQSVQESSWFGTASRQDVPLRAGDEILVLPKIDVKSRQIFKELSAIIFQIALSAKVIIGL